MLVGIFIGFWVGILPGLGGAATLALMLPFIYNMDPTSAFAFLLGSTAVTSTTGARCAARSSRGTIMYTRVVIVWFPN